MRAAVLQHDGFLRPIVLDLEKALGEKNPAYCYTEEEARARYGAGEGREAGGDVQVCGTILPKKRAIKFAVLCGARPRPCRAGKPGVCVPLAQGCTRGRVWVQRAVQAAASACVLRMRGPRATLFCCAVPKQWTEAACERKGMRGTSAAHSALEWSCRAKGWRGFYEAQL